MPSAMVAGIFQMPFAIVAGLRHTRRVPATLGYGTRCVPATLASSKCPTQLLQHVL
jgi:hypothetical protein